ncbi:DNA alkylation repair protein [Phocaeicola faecium]|uniref:DNA alkylation repair protein n=1 Tax=Phocaeicola faecium TaxID=2762213 RepID=A0ABR8VA12_9BACT|nr:DNA alkylation repair protein [Phocaeicola faecium]MBD8001587.1 DNA alkylation repair protein [Phocaeicola faecium]
MHETLKEIKSKLRLYMNGMISQSMRDKGMDYKLNFGIEYPRIKEIAAEYEPNHDLAQALWKENIRECKIMAGLLQPVDSFYQDIAEIWIEDIHYPELAEYTVMNLFQHLPYASEVIFPWMANEREYFQVCGFLLTARLIMQGLQLDDRAEAEFFDQAFTGLESDSLQVRKAAATALRKYGTRSKNNWKKISRPLGLLCKSDKPDVCALADEIKNEIEYCLQSF